MLWTVLVFSWIRCRLDAIFLVLLLITSCKLMDDLVFAPYVKGVQTQLGVCSKFGRTNDFLYNCQRSQIMLFNARKYSCTADIYLSNSQWNIQSRSNITRLIWSARKGICNLLICKVYYCSFDVKTDCSNCLW